MVKVKIDKETVFKINNDKGQIAIFIALIFQVLFVLFAMTINVALVVHDKINLQNSVDLAAYYAAQRQAEMLNAIAHQNYAIRQSWKLLSWRYRVLGTMGYDQGLAIHPSRSGDISETPYSHGGDGPIPPVCVNYRPNWPTPSATENLCNRPNLVIPALPVVPTIAGFFGLNIAITALSVNLRNQFNLRCENHGAYNWWFSAAIMQAFRMDQANRKQVIYALADNLSQRQDNDFLDLEGNSVYQGATNTFLKNLTFANANGNPPPTFDMYNSLQGIDRRSWLPEIVINPTMYYVDALDTASCVASVKHITQLPERPGAQGFLRSPNGLNANDLIVWYEHDSIFLDNIYQFSLGVEKNPWLMAYVGVKATTTPRQIFFPFGPSITMQARAYAKPFGGRIGPWHGTRWSRGALQSAGGQTDLFVPPRPNFISSNPGHPRRFPNYSRFPGDQLGLSSKLAQNSMLNLATLGLDYMFYFGIYSGFSPNGDNDILAWNGQTNMAPGARFYEISALAPDLFDITYYSIDSNFTANYLAKLAPNRERFGIPTSVPVRGDLGNHGLAAPNFSVEQQIDAVQQIRRPEAFFFVRDRFNLLTAWVPGNDAFEYPEEPHPGKFGKCGRPDTDRLVKNPGSCIAQGGRTGYSVKLISRSYLFSPNQEIGGDGEAPGSILNPPPVDSGW